MTGHFDSRGGTIDYMFQEHKFSTYKESSGVVLGEGKVETENDERVYLRREVGLTS